MNYSVYEIKNTKNSRIYYGVSQELGKRLRSHKNQLLNDSHNNVSLQDDWNKYGETSFEATEIKAFASREEAESFEMYLVNKDSRCYNVVRDRSSGGDYFTHNPRKEEIRKKKSESMSGKNNHQYGKPKTEKMINAVKEANSKPVNILGVRYPSATEASKALNLKKSTVHYRLNAKSKRFAEWNFI